MVSVDILMPVYNCEKSLDEAILSIVRQTHADWRLWMVDDASTDGSGEIAFAWASRDARIQVLAGKKNVGPGAALNHAAFASLSAYVAIMHSDDVSEPQRIERQLQFLEGNSEVDVVGGAATYVSSDGTNLGVLRLPSEHAEIVRRIPWSAPFIHPTVMMRRTFLMGLGGYAHRRRTEDADLWIRGASHYRYHNLSHVVLEYRVPKSMTWASLREGVGVRLSARNAGYGSVTALRSAARFGGAGLATKMGRPGHWARKIS